MKLLFICNANAEVGFGHFSRCRIIANSLKEFISKVDIYFSGNIEMNLLDSINTNNLKFISSPKYEDFDCVILDSYEKNDFNEINNLNLKKIAIDDKGLQSFLDWDLVLNFRLNPVNFNYKSKEVCQGTDFFPFDKRLKLLRLESKPKKQFKNLFFYFGDTKKIILDNKSEALIKKYKEKYNFFISTTNSNELLNCEEITRSNFFDLFSKSDVIISGGGLTKYEAAFSKKINLTFSINELQKKDTEILSEFFLTNDMGYFKNFNNSLLESLEKLENLQNDEIKLFYANSSKYFNTESLDNITKKITNIVI